MEFSIKTYFCNKWAYNPETLEKYVRAYLVKETGDKALDTFFRPDEKTVNLINSEEDLGIRLIGTAMDRNLGFSKMEIDVAIQSIVRDNILLEINGYSLEAKITTNTRGVTFVNRKARFLLQDLSKYGGPDIM